VSLLRIVNDRRVPTPKDTHARVPHGVLATSPLVSSTWISPVATSSNTYQHLPHATPLGCVQTIVTEVWCKYHHASTTHFYNVKLRNVILRYVTAPKECVKCPVVIVSSGHKSHKATKYQPSPAHYPSLTQRYVSAMLRCVTAPRVCVKCPVVLVSSDHRSHGTL
jgi:hypothetical protein